MNDLQQDDRLKAHDASPQTGHRTTAAGQMTATRARVDLRPMLDTDAEIAAEIVYDAIMHGTVGQYTLNERRAWAGPGRDPERWRDRIGDAVGLMAELDGRPVGFMTLMGTSLIDLSFVRADMARRGVGAALFEALEPIARAIGATRLKTHASKTARPFFERHGFAVTAERRMERRGFMLEGYEMKKPLV